MLSGRTTSAWGEKEDTVATTFGDYGDQEKRRKQNKGEKREARRAEGTRIISRLCSDEL